jgi:hypothetical protein
MFGHYKPSVIPTSTESKRPQIIESLESRVLCSGSPLYPETAAPHAALPHYAAREAIHVQARPNLDSTSRELQTASPMARRASRQSQVTNVVGTWEGTWRLNKGRASGTVHIVVTSQRRGRISGSITIDGEETVSGSARITVKSNGGFTVQARGDGWSARVSGRLNRNATSASGQWSYAEAGEGTLRGTFQLRRL